MNPRKEVELVRKRFSLPSDKGTSRHFYAVIGVAGAVTFVYIDLDEDASDQIRALDTELFFKFGHPLYPLGCGVDYHSRTKTDHGIYTAECPALDGAKCWSDGSALMAQELLIEWMASGRDDNVIWDRLAEMYEGWL